MLDGLLKVIENLNSFSFAETTQKILRIDSKDIVTAVQSQLSLGIDGNDDPVTLYGRDKYSKYTVLIKEIYGVGIGRETDVITNYMTGEFYSSLFVKVFDDGSFEVSSNSPLLPEIRLRSGNSIVDLSPTSMQFLIDRKIAPQFQLSINSLFYAK